MGRADRGWLGTQRRKLCHACYRSSLQAVPRGHDTSLSARAKSLHAFLPRLDLTASHHPDVLGSNCGTATVMIPRQANRDGEHLTACRMRRSSPQSQGWTADGNRAMHVMPPLAPRRPERTAASDHGMCTVSHCHARGAIPPQGSPIGTGTPAQMGASGAAGDSLRAVWPWYDAPEVEEPLDATKDDLAGGLPSRLLDTARAVEMRVQARACLAKMYSYLESTMAKFLVGTKCHVSTNTAATYCRSWRVDGHTSDLLKRHYLILRLASGSAGWLARVILLVFREAGDLKTYLYMVSAHNLSLWYHLGLQDPVPTSAFLFVRWRLCNDFAYRCTCLMVNTKRCTGGRGRVQSYADPYSEDNQQSRSILQRPRTMEIYTGGDVHAE